MCGCFQDVLIIKPPLIPASLELLRVCLGNLGCILTNSCRGDVLWLHQDHERESESNLCSGVNIF